MPQSSDAYCKLLVKRKIPVIKAMITKDPLPIEDESFEVVIFSEVFEHLRVPPLKVLNDIYRILKKGGFLIFSTPNIGCFRNITHLLFGKNILQPFPYDSDLSNVTDSLVHVRTYTMAEILDLMNKANFEVVSSRYFQIEKLRLGLRLGLLRHVIYMTLVKMFYPLRDALFVIGKK